jgi:hypothetical protein
MKLLLSPITPLQSDFLKTYKGGGGGGGGHKLVVRHPQNRRDEYPAQPSLSPGGCDSARHLCLFSPSKLLLEETSRARIDVIFVG